MLSERYPNAIQISAKDPSDVKRLHGIIVQDFERLLDDLTLVVPYNQSALIGEVHKRARVISESFEDDGVHYQLKIATTEAERLLRMLT
jgi:GTP-binding protein HflX